MALDKSLNTVLKKKNRDPSQGQLLVEMLSISSTCHSILYRFVIFGFYVEMCCFSVPSFVYYEAMLGLVANLFSLGLNNSFDYCCEVFHVLLCVH